MATAAGTQKHQNMVELIINIEVKGTQAMILKLRRASRELFNFMLDLKFRQSKQILNGVDPDILIVTPETMKNMVDLCVDPITKVVLQVDPEDLPEGKTSIYCWTFDTYKAQEIKEPGDFSRLDLDDGIREETAFIYAHNVTEHLEWQENHKQK